MGRQFTQDQLNDIMEQGMVRQCACPALLTRLLSDTRYLHEYQKSCLAGSPADYRVHLAIARVTELVSSILEESLIEVMALEGWEVNGTGTITMPQHLIDLQMEAVNCSLRVS